MTGDLNMGGQSINNAKDITASGDVNATSFNGTYGRFAKNVNVSEDLNVIGFSTFGKNVSMNSQLTVKNGINSENYISAKTQSSKLQIGGGGTSDPNMILLNVSGGAGDGYLSLNGNNNSSVKLDIWGSQRVRGDLTLSGSNDGKTTGAISASGNIASSGTVSGQYLQPISTIVSGATCVSLGAISKDSAGDIYSCSDGTWKKPSSDVVVGIYGIYNDQNNNKGCYFTNSVTKQCSCNNNQYPMLISSWSKTTTHGGGGNGSGYESTANWNIYACASK
ncbi:hypothetical protein [Pectobacterium brasiliense]|uniref:hypothetical protein n=1 Tax=Pectobacterium brasiliense TaxID=180957 RepID=UPI001F07EF33|nr:hypothetical protein [Pectobacterium brasiliense]